MTSVPHTETAKKVPLPRKLITRSRAFLSLRKSRPHLDSFPPSQFSSFSLHPVSRLTLKKTVSSSPFTLYCLKKKIYFFCFIFFFTKFMEKIDELKAKSMASNSTTANPSKDIETSKAREEGELSDTDDDVFFSLSLSSKP